MTDTETNVDQNLHMEEDPAEPVHYVGFWARFVAFFVDSAAATILIAPLASRLVGEINILNYNLSDPDDARELLTLLATQMSVDMLLLGTIFVLFWIYKNATPGKMIFRAVIVDARTLAAPTASQNIIRYLAYFVSLIPLGLGFLWIAFDRRKQGWHDKLAGTVVIKGKPRASGDDHS